VLAVAQELLEDTTAVDGPAFDEEWLATVVEDLQENRRHAVLIAGRQQPAWVHALVARINAALEAPGHTVSYVTPEDTYSSDGEGLQALTTAMQGGEVQTLVVLGANPVYNAPADLGFAAAYEKVANRIHLGLYPDETAVASTWHLPQTHFLEAWGDARGYDGTLGLIQPLIAPLWEEAENSVGVRSALELLHLLGTGDEKGGYDIVRAVWDGRFLQGSGDPEGTWRRTLHDGVLPDSGFPVRRVGEARKGSVGQLHDEGLEVNLRLSPCLHDGRFANNGWLQETPEPMSKLTWDNAAFMSPATARELGLRVELGRIGRQYADLVTLSAGEGSVTVPAVALPGHADDSVTLQLGYGRDFDCKIAAGVGANAYPLRTMDALHLRHGVQVVATGETQMIAGVQDHHQMEGRAIAKESTVDAWQDYGKDSLRPKSHHPPTDPETGEPLNISEYPLDYSKGNQWAMTIDLDRCTGCIPCVVACQSENNVPIVGKGRVAEGREMHWIRIDRYFHGGDTSEPEATVQPVPCMHCENAPCETVCPVNATVHDDEGLNVMVYNRCIGTRYCSNNCPYKVRRFNFFSYTYEAPQVRLALGDGLEKEYTRFVKGETPSKAYRERAMEMYKLSQNPEVTPRFRGVMEKCTYCVQRIKAAQVEAKLENRPVRDGEVRTACQQTCPTQAITFGDKNDAGSKVAARRQDPRNFAVLEEFNTRPRTTYLARLRNPHPRLAPELPHDLHHTTEGDGHGGHGEEAESSHGAEAGHGH